MKNILTGDFLIFSIDAWQAKFRSFDPGIPFQISVLHAGMACLGF